jgi:hypothetical protein
MTCAMNFGQVTPKFVKISEITSISEGIGPSAGKADGQMSLTALESENQRINRDGFRKGHAEDAERKHAPKGAWVASDSFRRLRADQADSDPGTEARHAQGETTGYTRGHGFCSKNRKDHILALLWVVFLTVRRLARSRWEIS